MKFILAVILSLSLTGCFYQSTSQYDIHRATAYCGSVSNIEKINVEFQGDENVRCYDGRQVSLNEVKGERK